MILHIYEPTNGFFDSCKRRKEIIIHIGGLVSDFFTHICEKKMTFHNCEPTSEFFDSHMKGKNDIAHLQAHKWFLFIHIDEEKKDIAHL